MCVFLARAPRYAIRMPVHPLFGLKRTPHILRLDPAVGIAIRLARKAASLSQAQLARVCGVTVRHIFAIERGSRFFVTLLLKNVRELPALRLPGVAASLLSSSADHPYDTAPPHKPRRTRSKTPRQR
jgi:DNA-binding XRE family transcriptional regulator